MRSSGKYDYELAADLTDNTDFLATFKLSETDTKTLVWTPLPVSIGEACARFWQTQDERHKKRKSIPKISTEFNYTTKIWL
jgi:hypothetical protein